MTRPVLNAADTLRRASARMRERAEATVSVFAATGEEVPWHSEASLEHEWDEEDAAHIAAWHPAVALAVADWLGRAAEHHRSETVDDLYLWDCDECPEGDCVGHTRDCCWGCVSQDEDGYAGRVSYPCGEMTAALAVARAYLGEQP